MKNLLLLVLYAFGAILLVGVSQPILAQAFPTSGSAICGTVTLSFGQRLLLMQQAKLARQRKGAARSIPTAITYVPIRPHIVRKNDGTGGYPLANLNEAMATTNRYFLLNGFGIQFYFAGDSPDYIDDDGLHQSFIGYPANRDAHDALNQYYVNLLPPEVKNSGFANFPADNLESTRSVIRTYGSDGDSFKFGFYLIPHELGHNFGLYHTFGFGSGEIPTDELVTRGPGANCETAGDFICDTPADPFGIPGADPIVVNGCYQYNPNSPARDANGEPYSPLISNLMSYYSSCTFDFTPGQIDRMQDGLALRQSHTSYSLLAPATNVNPPTGLNLSLTVSTLNSVVLTWQDNATNEMGYFIERSTSPTTGFVSVGGVAPNATTFTDNQITLNNRYYYRIRPSNTTLNNLSPTVSISTNPCQPPIYLSSDPARISASLFWSAVTSDQTYTLLWRPAGVQNWNMINNIAAGTSYSSMYSLTGLTSATAYEWQLQGVCSATSSSEFTNIQSFTTLSCTNLSGAQTTNLGSTSVQFSWYNNRDEPGRTADIRYRVVGAPTWTTISNLTGPHYSSTYSLTGLTNNTTYEWQMRNVCSVSEQSDYTPLATFTTVCRIPTGLNDQPMATGAILNWSVNNLFGAVPTFDVRYRPVGSTAWNMVSTTAGTPSGNIYLLTGLTANTQYEWQIRTACSANTYSDYSGVKQFTTICNKPMAYGLSATQRTSSSVQLNWSVVNTPGTRYDIRYRPVGITDWVTVSGSTTMVYGGSYMLTGLTNNTAYEWAIRAVCSPDGTSDYVAGPNFATQCRLPSYVYNYAKVTSADLIWEAVAADVTYDIYYRRLGTTDWSILSHITSSSISLTGLAGNTSYEYQLRTNCQEGVSSDSSPASTLTTHPCTYPGTMQTTAITASSAQLNWQFFDWNADTHYEVRYRIVGTNNWVTRSNLASTAIAGNSVLTGLTSNSSYEWQIRTLCSGTEGSDFSYSINFQTLVAGPDLTPILYARPSTVSGASDFNLVVDVVEVNSVASSGSFTVKITRDAKVSLSFPPMATQVGGRSVQNSAWTFSATDPNYYILSTSQSVAAGNKLSFGLTGTLKPGATTGVVTMSSILLANSLVEDRLTNNVDSDKVDYFQQ